MKSYKGKISKFLFIGENNSKYAIAEFKLIGTSREKIIIAGMIAFLSPILDYEIFGNMVTDKKGRSKFEIEKYVQIKSNNENLDTWINYFKSDKFPGIGIELAKKIVDYYKDDFINKIYLNPESLLEIKEMTKKNANNISKTIIDEYKIKKYRELFIENNLNENILEIILDNCGETNFVEIDSVLNEKIYDIFLHMRRFNFEDIDKISVCYHKNMKDDFDEFIFSEKRICYYINEIVNSIIEKTKNSYCYKNDFDEFFLKNINSILYNKKIKEENIIKWLTYAKNNKILIFSIEENTNNRIIYSKYSYNEEVKIAMWLNDIKNKKNFTEDIEFDDIYKKLELIYKNLKKPFFFDEEQKKCLKSILENNVSIITGGPGTGKTALIQAIYHMFSTDKVIQKKEIAVLTPTGRAASRIKEISDWSIDARTIHSYFEYGWKYDRNYETSNIDVLIIDEASMIGNSLFYFIAKYSHINCKVILVGDVNQLQSIEYGNLFQDIIDSNIFNVINLKKNYRSGLSNKKRNGIIELTNSIIENKIDEFDFLNYDDITFIELNNTENDYKQILNTYNLLKKKYYKDKEKDKDLDEYLNYYNFSQTIQLITPMIQGELGVKKINSLIQNKSFKKINKYNNYKNKDKIMCLKNDLAKSISNGDIGIIKELNQDHLNQIDDIKIYINGENINFTSGDFDKIMLGYACTIHKVQGSEFDNIILVLDISNNASNWFINKNMLYTAVSRAKQHLYIFGTKNIFAKCCKNIVKRRATTLSKRINEYANYQKEY